MSTRFAPIGALLALGLLAACAGPQAAQPTATAKAPAVHKTAAAKPHAATNVAAAPAKPAGVPAAHIKVAYAGLEGTMGTQGAAIVLTDDGHAVFMTKYIGVGFSQDKPPALSMLKPYAVDPSSIKVTPTKISLKTSAGSPLSVTVNGDLADGTIYPVGFQGGLPLHLRRLNLPATATIDLPVGKVAER